MNHVDIEKERIRCAFSPTYFIDNYTYIYDKKAKRWIRFRLWYSQAQVLSTMSHYQSIAILKARQIGLTWLALGYALWSMLFRPEARVLLFSKGELEAIEMLDGRLKGMYLRLPPYLQCRKVSKDTSKNFRLSNGSVAKAFSSRRGRGEPGTLAIIDECDHILNLQKILEAVRPTVEDGGGQLFLISTPDTRLPISPFKNIIRANDPGWEIVFLPWHSHPNRNLQWYRKRYEEEMALHGTADGFTQEYPETIEEALAGRSEDKRLNLARLKECYIGMLEVEEGLRRNVPYVPGLEIYSLPAPGKRYGIGGDSADNGPYSHDSAANLVDMETFEQVARFGGIMEPAVFASYLATLATYYNGADIMVERNNHGAAVLLWLNEQRSNHYYKFRILKGLDGRDGWMSTTQGKALAYAEVANVVNQRGCTIHSPITYAQLASIEKATLRAPKGLADDDADAWSFIIASSLVQMKAKKGGAWI